MTLSRLTLATVGLAMAGSVAHATPFSEDITPGTTSTVAGAVALAFTSGDFSGGAIYNTTILNVTAQPPGTSGNYWSVGATTPGVVTFPIPLVYYGFLWGSPDAYNTVSFYDGSTLLASYTGTDVFGAAANGYQGPVAGGQYFNAFAGTGQVITSVDFSSTQPAFETVNDAIILDGPTVPEPGALSLVGLSLLAVGGMMWRRKPVAPKRVA